MSGAPARGRGEECNTRRALPSPPLAHNTLSALAVTRPRDVAADAELFNFLAESAQEYVHKLKQVGAGCCCGWMGASIRGWMGAVASWPARRPVPPMLSFVSLKPEQAAAAVAGVLTSATHPVACSQGGRAHSSADLLRRLKTRFVEGLDVEEDDPFAFDWCGFQLLRCSRCMLGCGCGCLGEAVRCPRRAEQMQECACSRIDPHVLRRAFARRQPAAAESTCLPCLPPLFRRAKLGQGRSVTLLFRSVPATHHMLGPLDAQPRQRRAVQRQAKRKAPVGERQRG